MGDPDALRQHQCSLAWRIPGAASSQHMFVLGAGLDRSRANGSDRSYRLLGRHAEFDQQARRDHAGTA